MAGNNLVLFFTIAVTIVAYMRNVISSDITSGNTSAVSSEYDFVYIPTNWSTPTIFALTDDEVCHPRSNCLTCVQNCTFHKAHELSEFPSICLPDGRKPDIGYLIYESIADERDCEGHEIRKPEPHWIPGRDRGDDDNFEDDYYSPAYDLNDDIIHGNDSVYNNNNNSNSTRYIGWTDIEFDPWHLIPAIFLGILVTVFFIGFVVYKIISRIEGRASFDIQLNNISV